MSILDQGGGLFQRKFDAIMKHKLLFFGSLVLILIGLGVSGFIALIGFGLFIFSLFLIAKN